MASRRTFIAAVLTLTVAVAATSAVSPAAGNERAKRAPTPIRVDAMHGRASVSGRVFDESGKPLVGARVSVYGLADLLESQGSYEFAWVATPPAPRGTATTDAAGRYSVTDLVRGMNVVRVETEGGDRSAALATAIEDRPVAITLRTVSSHVVIRGNGRPCVQIAFGGSSSTRAAQGSPPHPSSLSPTPTFRARQHYSGSQWRPRARRRMGPASSRCRPRQSPYSWRP